jgi:hypothetical protein
MKPSAVHVKFLGTVALSLLSLPVVAQAPSGAATLPNTPPPLAINPIAPSPATALPPLTLPTVAVPDPAASPVAQPTASELPAVASSPAASSTVTDGQAPADTATQDALPIPKVYSFGDSETSILFLPDQISRMKDAIRTFEDSGKDADKPAPIIDVVAAPTAPEIIEDPLIYPVFYLSSIAYDHASDWSIWLSGYKITSRRNYTDVTVLHVTRDSVTFLWKPSFMKAITKRNKDKLFAPIEPVKHKLVPSQAFSFDPVAGSITFTLKPNQSFAPGYFKTFEGYIDTPTLTALPVVVAAGANAGQPAFNQPVNEAFDANGNPIDNGLNAANPLGFSPPSTNFNPPARQ